MDLESFIEMVKIADPFLVQMVEEGYCSWEDIGYDGDRLNDEYGDDWDIGDPPGHLNDDYGNYPHAGE